LGAVLVVTVLIIGAIFSIFKTIIQPTRANYATTRAVVASWEGDHAKALAKFREALSYKTFGSYEIRHRFSQYVFENFNTYAGQARLDIFLYLIEELEEHSISRQ